MEVPTVIQYMYIRKGQQVKCPVSLHENSHMLHIYTCTCTYMLHIYTCIIHVHTCIRGTCTCMYLSGQACTLLHHSCVKRSLKSDTISVSGIYLNNANARLVKPSNGLRKKQNTQVVNIANATFRSPGPSSGNIQTKNTET